MAKKSIVEREKKRKKLSEKYYKLRKNLNEEVRKVDSFDKKLFFNSLLQKLPRNSSPSRIVRFY